MKLTMEKMGGESERVSASPVKKNFLRKLQSKEDRGEENTEPNFDSRVGMMYSNERRKGKTDYLSVRIKRLADN